jgi:hypothetical protein
MALFVESHLLSRHIETPSLRIALSVSSAVGVLHASRSELAVTGSWVAVTSVSCRAVAVFKSVDAVSGLKIAAIYSTSVSIIAVFGSVRACSGIDITRSEGAHVSRHALGSVNTADSCVVLIGGASVVVVTNRNDCIAVSGGAVALVSDSASSW